MTRPSFRQQVLRAREDAILASVNRLLAEKGFDSMTIDEVAADVGIAKASLYKHFASKEELAAAAMVQVLDRALAFLAVQADANASALERVRAAARWTMQVQLAGEMPSLPAQNSALRSALVADRAYTDKLMELSEVLGGWIVEAQKSGQLNPKLPSEVILYTLFGRACDPVLGLLKSSGNYPDERIVEMMMSTCFDGLAGGTAPGRARTAVVRASTPLGRPSP
ncbi:MAG TPA: helix-turn-helix domain-containing protein [Burkholderiaceae bacterium]|jgi:AcrR family transcriptional regulator|nr:helix-turn-helix domain-containing protein [Burkholderiaceae bacterium]